MEEYEDDAGHCFRTLPLKQTLEQFIDYLQNWSVNGMLEDICARNDEKGLTTVYIRKELKMVDRDWVRCESKKEGYKLMVEKAKFDYEFVSNWAAEDSYLDRLQCEFHKYDNVHYPGEPNVYEQIM